jgi:hypothetical protein
LSICTSPANAACKPRHSQIGGAPFFHSRRQLFANAAMVASRFAHQDGEHQSGVIGPRGLPKAVVGTFEPFIYVRSTSLKCVKK